MGLVDITYIVYLNDILIFSNDKASYKLYIHEVLDYLRKANLYVNVDKC